jgi:hypothetical protein
MMVSLDGLIEAPGGDIVRGIKDLKARSFGSGVVILKCAIKGAQE